MTDIDPETTAAPAAEKAALIEQAREVARALGADRLALAEFARRTGVREAWILRHFDRWSDLCRAAGLKPGGLGAERIADDEVFAAMRDAFLAAGGIVRREVFARHFRYSTGAFITRGGNYGAVLRRLLDWLAVHDPAFPHMAALERRLASPKYRAAPPPEAAPAPGALLGERIDFGALEHAPTNEQGVVFLFGVAAERLGYLVERLGPAFPDCCAKRREPDGRWRRLRIEFEFRARTFRVHAHDPAGCDLIVCWENNWRDCPIPVLALKDEIEKLRGA
jgi:hypothetical protein